MLIVVGPVLAHWAVLCGAVRARSCRYLTAARVTLTSLKGRILHIWRLYDLMVLRGCFGQPTLAQLVLCRLRLLEVKCRVLGSLGRHEVIYSSRGLSTAGVVS